MMSPLGRPISVGPPRAKGRLKDELRALSLVLVLQAVVLYAAISRSEILPVVLPLNQFPNALGTWRTIKDVPIEPDVQE